MSSKIEQQIYTREKKGMFRLSEGYDTIAASCGLSEVFIKENIHPYCTYPPSRILKNKTENHPKAITITHYQTGQMLLGQASYVSKDFTGQRSTFFVHNYILPPTVAGDVLDGNTPANIKFLTEYDINQGSNLLALEKLPTTEKINSTNPIEGLDVLVECIHYAVENSKKISVIVDVEQICMDFYISCLLAQIYMNLAVHIKHKLGICTFAREPLNKKGIHLVFLEKAAVSANDSRLINDFVFIASEKFIKPVKNLKNSGLSKNLEEYLYNLIPTLTPDKFFFELNFWKARIKTLTNQSWLIKAEENWLNMMLENLTCSQLAAIPGEFINRGKAQPNPEIYVILGILKTAAGALNSRTSLDLRYFLGSYPLSPAGYERVIENLRRIYANQTKVEDINNVKFLFRDRITGKLDNTGLDKYMEIFATSVID